MSRRWIVSVLLVLLAVGLVLAERAGTSEPDWRPSYEHDVSEPRGGRVLYAILPELAGAPVRRLAGAPYRHLRDPNRTGETYFVLTTQFEPDSALAEVLLGYAGRGNSVFVAAEHVGGTLARRLGIASRRRTQFTRPTTADSVLRLANPRLRQPGGYHFDEPLAWSSMTLREKARLTVLGYARDTLITYVRVPVGQGEVYVLSTPRALSNAALLSGDGAAFAAAALSYLPAQPVVWDTHYKPMRSREGAALRFVQEDPALGWAYYLLLAGAVLFVLFRGRRWQRPIPVVEPPPNYALDFARTVGRLYHQRGDDALLVERKTQHLLDRLRRALHDPDLSLAPEHRTRIAGSLDLPREDVDALFDLILHLRSTKRIRPDDLLALDRRAHALLTRL